MKEYDGPGYEVDGKVIGERHGHAPCSRCATRIAELENVLRGFLKDGKGLPPTHPEFPSYSFHPENLWKSARRVATGKRGW